MKNIKTTNFGRTYLMISIPVGIILSILFLVYMSNDRSYLLKNYPTIEKVTEISGRVSKVKLERGIFCIDFADGRRAKDMEKIYNEKKQSIAFFLKEYDSIYKKANNDTINVKRYGISYYFILRY
jgi:hypothetical protein